MALKELSLFEKPHTEQTKSTISVVGTFITQISNVAMIKENILTSTVLNTDVVWGTVKYWILNTIWIHYTFLTTAAPCYNSSWNENINVRTKKTAERLFFPQNNNN